MYQDNSDIVDKMRFRHGIKKVMMWLGLFVLWIAGFYLIKYLEGNDTEAIIYFVFEASFLIITCVAAQWIPSDRRESLKLGLIGSLGYIAYNLLFDTILIFASMGSSQSMTITVLTNIVTYSRVVIPLGLILWQAKKFTFLTGLRKSKQEAIDYYKHNGNNGMH